MDESCDKKIMSGRLSTPRDVKDVIFSRISGTSGDNNHLFEDKNNCQSSHDNLWFTNYSDNNHQHFLTPNDIKCQYDYCWSDSNNNHSIFNKNIGNSNYLSSYQSQGETNDEYNRQKYSNFGDNNHQQYYDHTYKDAINHHNLGYIGNIVTAKPMLLTVTTTTLAKTTASLTQRKMVTSIIFIMRKIFLILVKITTTPLTLTIVKKVFS